MKTRKTLLTTLAGVLALAMVFSLCGCGQMQNPSSPQVSSSASIYEKYPNAHLLRLSGNEAVLDGKLLPSFDYTWQVDPSFEGEMYTGTKPSEDLDAYIAHDIIYYPQIEESQFSKENYDGETEWVTRYTAKGLEQYIFGTLPLLGSDLPKEMMHTASEAYNNPVIHITKPGEYIVEGSFDGQLMFDLGDEDETFTDENAKAILILNGASISCGVAPGVIFKNVYECDNTWEERTEYSNETDLSNAGAKIIIADGTENSVTGANVYRLLKPTYKKDSTSVQKKLWKMDGAFYSYSSLLICGEQQGTGILNITSTTFEGLDSELHLTIDGAYINIYSADDGINVNEDDVSVFTLNDGHLTIFASLGSEGDVIDSNGFIKINGGFLAGTSKSPSDELLDSECGTEISENATVVYGGGMAEGGMTRPGGFGGEPFDDNRPFGKEPPEGFGSDKPFDGNKPFGQEPPEGFGGSKW